jgi:predicted nucleic acid-binding protein
VIVPDASAIIEMLTRSERGQRVEARLLSDRMSPHAPPCSTSKWRRFFAGMLRGDVTASWAGSAIKVMTAFPVTRYMHEPMMTRIWQLREAVTAYDAAYVALAEALGAPLVTCDARLGKVKGFRAPVEVIA